MSDHPFVQFYTSDFLAGTGGMTAATKGVYITLMCLVYESEEPLLQSWETLARRSGSTLPAFKKAVEVLVDDGKVTVKNGAIWCPKCEKHIALRRQRQVSAKAAAKKRWEKSEENQCEADASASNTQCKPEPEPEPVVKEPNGSLPPVSPKGDLFGDEEKPKPKAPPKQFLPEGWVPSDTDIQYARNQGLHDNEIMEIANDFQIYWSERRDAKAKRTERGWGQAWRGRVRQLASQYVRNRRVGTGPQAIRSGQHVSFADVILQRESGN